jgi:hypothetical protein
MSHSGHRGKPGAASGANQTELPLRIAVCAWCKPRELGAALGALSHGICPRHFREMKIDLESRLPGRAVAPVRSRIRRSRKLRSAIEEIAQLRFPFPAPLAAASHFSA